MRWLNKTSRFSQVLSGEAHQSWASQVEVRWRRYVKQSRDVVRNEIEELDFQMPKIPNISPIKRGSMPKRDNKASLFDLVEDWMKVQH